MTTRQIKFCRCCGTKAFGRKRVCPRCKVPAIWDRATPDQIEAHDSQRAKTEALILELMAESK